MIYIYICDVRAKSKKVELETDPTRYPLYVKIVFVCHYVTISLGFIDFVAFFGRLPFRFGRPLDVRVGLRLSAAIKFSHGFSA